MAGLTPLDLLAAGPGAAGIATAAAAGFRREQPARTGGAAVGVAVAMPFDGTDTPKPIAKAVVVKAVKKGGMSAQAKANQSAKMKAYWAAKKAAKVKPVAVKPAKKKFKMSAAAKAKLSALMKARWAKKKK